ncbi:hypothetical protein E4S40_11850 [Algoriphagus kandeliae]|uniref:Acetyltransferase n=1 Tax=Algoriphagus kandeliae TaxID=2562278 RepID=A0A4Y9QUM5_9BACT|nr:hypothetical protein [Algoriphagus kandeliae]TFV94695.1 hypothetical protein E4S40_11850 [Algoriphagus kandeliae]
MKKLVILGHSDGGVPIVMDMAAEIFGCRSFDIVKNINRPNCPLPGELYEAVHIFDKEYDFDLNRSHSVQFGVQHGNVKYVLYHHFFKNFQIGRERYIDLIHSSSYFAPSASAKGGLIMEPLSVVSTMSQLGFGVTLKRSASVGHHAILEDFVNVNPGAVLSGFVSIGEGSEIGTGAIISNNIKIGKRCLIGAGSVVTRDIPDGVIAYGNPCKVIRENERWAKLNLEI